MLAGMPILTAFKYYDVAKYVTALAFQQIVSVSVVNEAWFQSQSPEHQEAIRQAGREAEEAVLSWGIANVERANQAWRDNGGEILSLSAEEQEEMMTRFSEIGSGILSSDPAVWAEYEHLMEVVEAKRDQ
jgi:TRAP-type C4-dicarboxylate transport system substrate-binding protein